MGWGWGIKKHEKHERRQPHKHSSTYLMKYFFLLMSLSNEINKNKNTPIDPRSLFTLIALNFFIINIIIVIDLYFENKSKLVALFC